MPFYAYKDHPLDTEPEVSAATQSREAIQEIFSGALLKQTPTCKFHYSDGATSDSTQVIFSTGDLEIQVTQDFHALFARVISKSGKMYDPESTNTEIESKVNKIARAIFKEAKTVDFQIKQKRGAESLGRASKLTPELWVSTLGWWGDGNSLIFGGTKRCGPPLLVVPMLLDTQTNWFNGIMYCVNYNKRMQKKREEERAKQRDERLAKERADDEELSKKNRQREVEEMKNALQKTNPDLMPTHVAPQAAPP